MIDTAGIDKESEAAPSYLVQLKSEVAKVQQELRRGSGTATADSPPLEDSWDKVTWVPVGRRAVEPPPPPLMSSDHSASVSSEAGRRTRILNPSPPYFEPLRRQTSSTPRGCSSTPFTLLSWLTSFATQTAKTEAENAAAAPSLRRPNQQQGDFFTAVQEALEDRFYTVELLYVPHQSLLSPYQLERWLWECLPDNVRIAGINTSPLDVLYFFPQGVFLTQKVGNSYRYRAVQRTIVAKHHVPSFSAHPIRYAASTLRRTRSYLCSFTSHIRSATDGLHAEWSLSDRMVATSPSSQQRRETASTALLRERTIDYLANPSRTLPP